MANSETITLGIKFMMFYALEFVVVALVGALLIAGVYQLVRDKIRSVRLARQHHSAAPVAVQKS